VIEDYKKHPSVNEILVIDNNSKDRTHELSLKAGARVVKEERQGYGCALQRGLAEANGDIIVLTEGDGSFRAKDVSKLLEYLKDCDMAIGTRTTRQMIEQGANMDFITRWANVFFGKLVEALWWNQEPRFTDVGCTYRAIWKTSYKSVLPYLKAHGPEFSTEMMIAMLIARKRVIEIPVTYYKRLGGDSKHSVNYTAKAKTALRMLKVTLKHRFRIGY
jgi:glycosyltransferase involved in cell wall biosynthesis